MKRPVGHSGIFPGFPLSQIVNGPDLSFDSQASHLRYLDEYGHGTHLAGIIVGNDTTTGLKGIAPKAKLTSIKVGAAGGVVGVKDIFGTFDNGAWTCAASTRTAWKGGVWMGRRLAGDGWTGTSWASRTWAGATWQATDWAGQAWADSAWSGRYWAGRYWAAGDWSGRYWASSTWQATSYSTKNWSSYGWY